MTTQTAPREGAPGIHVTGGRAVALVAVLIIGVLSYQLNASMLSPALPDMAATLHVSVSQVSQVTSLFFLAGAVGGVVLSRWSDFIGRRRTFFIVLGLLLVGTLICIVAPNLPVLLVGRVLQGASSAAFQLAYIILSQSLAARVFGTAMGIITAVNGGVGGLDGYVGGLLSDSFGYRSIFVVVFIFGLIALAAIALVVPKESAPSSTGRMDWWGAAVFSIGLICITYFVSEGSSVGWLAPATLIFLVGAIVAFVAFWMLEKRRRTPLVAVQHLRSRQVWPLLATTLLTLCGVFAVINFTVVLLAENTKVGFGMDAATSALLFLTPPALIGVVAAPVSGWLAARFGWLRLLRIGLIACIVAVAVIAIAPTTIAAVIAAVALLGIAYNGLALTTANGLGVLLTPEEARGTLPGLNSTAFGLGASLGIGIVAPFAGSGTLEGFVIALVISGVLTVLALAASMFIRPRVGTTV
jgi:predicted MFS family arabinose efflux permease